MLLRKLAKRNQKGGRIYLISDLNSGAYRGFSADRDGPFASKLAPTGKRVRSKCGSELAREGASEVSAKSLLNAGV
jgi:hypothetical protein